MEAEQQGEQQSAHTIWIIESTVRMSKSRPNTYKCKILFKDCFVVLYSALPVLQHFGAFKVLHFLLQSTVYCEERRKLGERKVD